jgi:hypothetical protein
MEPSSFLTRSGHNHHTPDPSAGHAEHGASGGRWGEDLLTQFGLRMARHGMSISRTQMCRDPVYAQQQISHARGMEDASLHQLANRLSAPVATQADATSATAH